MKIEEKLKSIGEKMCQEGHLADIRIGLGYTCVELQDGAAGIAWTPTRSAGSSCTHMPKAGTMQNFSELEAINLLSSNSHLERAIGLATFNAVNSRQKRDYSDEEAISMLNIQSTDRVVMVGHFAPLLPRIKKTGCTFNVIDLDSAKPGITDLSKGPDLLAECDVAILTATSIINGTIDDLLSQLKRNRAAVLLGPSTPACPEAFSDSRITQLSGSMVTDPEPLKRVISQGGGTMLLKKFVKFVNMSV